MKKERIYNTISLVCNIAILLFTTFAVSNYFRSDVIHHSEWYNFVGFESLRFFTELSNIAVALSGAIVIGFNIKNLICDDYKYPKWVLKLKYVCTVAVTLTMATVVLFLAPGSALVGKGFFSFFSGGSFFTHLINPLLAIFSFVFCERVEGFSFKNTFLGIIPTFLYGTVYFVMVVIIGEENGGWPDFYNFTFGGYKWAIAISIITMLSATYFFALALWAWQKKLKKE